MELENVETVETQNTQEVTTAADGVKPTSPVTPEVTPTKKSNPNEVLRELSKMYSVNLFDENGLAELKTKQETQSGAQTSLQEKLDLLQKEQSLFTEKEQAYQTKIEALALGFKQAQLDEVLALAKVNTKEGQTIADGLKIVKEKYGSVFATTTNIGIQHNDLKGDKLDIKKTEQEQYMSSSARVRAWEKAQKK